MRLSALSATVGQWVVGWYTQKVKTAWPYLGMAVTGGGGGVFLLFQVQMEKRVILP